jgi:hypothetical protein
VNTTNVTGRLLLPSYLVVVLEGTLEVVVGSVVEVVDVVTDVGPTLADEVGWLVVVVDEEDELEELLDELLLDVVADSRSRIVFTGCATSFGKSGTRRSTCPSSRPVASL